MAFTLKNKIVFILRKQAGIHNKIDYVTASYDMWWAERFILVEAACLLPKETENKAENKNDCKAATK